MISKEASERFYGAIVELCMSPGAVERLEKSATSSASDADKVRALTQLVTAFALEKGVAIAPNWSLSEIIKAIVPNNIFNPFTPFVTQIDAAANLVPTDNSLPTHVGADLSTAGSPDASGVMTPIESPYVPEKK